MTHRRSPQTSRPIRQPAGPPPRPTIPATAILPLRLFLGGMFVYAGLQKMADPVFLKPGTPGSLEQQMTAYVRGGSPLAPLITHLGLPHVAFFGVLIALAEIWIGLATLSGLLARPAAVGGLFTSLVFFLTATWNVRPFFLGADLPFAASWLTLLLTGPGPYALDTLRVSRDLAQRMAKGSRHRIASADAATLTRATFLRKCGQGLALAAFSAGLAAELRQRLAPQTSSASAPPRSTVASRGAEAARPIPSSTPTTGGTNTNPVVAQAPNPTAAAAPTRASAAPPPEPTAGVAGMTLLGNTSAVPVNEAAQYTDPSSGDPALLIHLPGGRFVAYDAVCTHAGCTVQYDPSQQAFVCPCHGAVFDAVHGGQVEIGPASQPLTSLPIHVAANGDIYVKSAT